MNKTIKTFLVVAVVATIATVSSCTKTCDKGYSGSNCKTVIRDAYLKTGASVTETCDSASAPYFVDVVTDNDAAKFRIKNLGNYGCTGGDYYVTVDVDNETGVTINSQTDCATQFTGSGTYSSANKTLTIQYSASYTNSTGSHVDNCTAIIQL